MTNETKAVIGQDIIWHESIFPVDIEGVDNNKIIEYYHETKKKSPEGVKNSNDGGYQIMIDPGECEELDKLVYALEDAATQIYNKGYDHKEKIVISNYWFNGNSFGDNNTVHNHPGATLSGVYYLTDGKVEHGTINFIRPNRSEIYSYRTPEEENAAAEDSPISYARQAEYTAKSSRALIFSPWLEHFVTANRTHDLRIVIGLNFTILGREDENPFLSF